MATDLTEDTPGADVKARRIAAGLTQVQLANRAELDPGSISRIERGQITPHPETLQRIYAALGVQ